MNQTKSFPKPHYAWVILAACCLIQGGILGLVQNCRGLFYNPVCSELGFTVSAFTLYSTAHGIGAVFVLPLAGRWIAKYPIRRVLGWATVFFAGSTAMMGCLSTLPQFYLTGAIQGMSGAFLIFLPAPILLNNWFHRRFGMAMGISASTSGIIGVLANPLWSRWIAQYGWRVGYLLLGGFCFLMVMSSVLFLVVRRPSDLGMLPYGAEEKVVSTGATLPPTVASPVLTTASPAVEAAQVRVPMSRSTKLALAFVAVFAACVGFYGTYCQHFANYAATLGLSTSVGAMLVSASMVGNIVGKLSLGAAGDHFGAFKTVCVSSALVGLAYGMMTWNQLPLIFSGALISGISMPIGVVCVPLVVKAVFGPARYGEFYSYVTMATSLVSSVSLAAIGGLYDLLGSYLPALWFGAGLTVVSVLFMALGFAVVRREKGAESGNL